MFLYFESAVITLFISVSLLYVTLMVMVEITDRVVLVTSDSKLPDACMFMMKVCLLIRMLGAIESIV